MDDSLRDIAGELPEIAGEKDHQGYDGDNVEKRDETIVFTITAGEALVMWAGRLV